MFSTQAKHKVVTPLGVILRASTRLVGRANNKVTIPCARRLRRRLDKLDPAPLAELRHKLRALGLTLTLSPFALVALAGVTLADPLGGVVVSGQASINQTTPGHTVIQQTTGKAIIDWQSFNIGAGEHTQFIQPSADSITLNRVNSTTPSEILGRLTANGGIMLINQHGIIIGQGAEIDVGSLIGSTADLSNDDFNAGNYRFNKGAQAAARIENHGRIQARSGGSVALVAPYVSNHGTITAHLGKVQLASGNTWTLDMGGLVKLALEDKVAGSLIQAGLIAADGGHIELTANVVETMLQQALQVGGTTRARTVGVNQKGNIVIGGGAENGTVTISGTLDVSGTESGQTAGQVTVTGQRVAMMDNATIDARGHQGGGEVKLGGDYQGGGTTHRAERTFIGQNASINADATTQGQGGRVIVWSDEGTQFYGNISARGGFVAGDGGFVEVSGLGGLDFAGQVTTTAVNGKNGTLLLDPYDLTISTAADSNVSGATPFSSTANSGVLNVTTLQNALASGNVVVQTGAGGAQNGDITVTDAITWTGPNSLTLQAHRNINVNNTISNTGGGSLSLISTGATGAITVASGIAVGNDLTMSSNTLALNANISGGGILSLYPNLAATTITVGTGGTGTFQLDATEQGRIQNGWSSIVLGRADGTGALDLRATTWNDPLTLRSLTGAVTTNGTQTMGTNDLTIRTNSINLAVANSLTGSGTLTIEQANNTTTMGFGASATGTLNLDANEVSRITDGWNLINLGRTDNTVGMQIRATTWNDPVVFRNGTGAITTSTGNTVGNGNASFTYNGAFTLSNNITTASGDIIFNNTFTVGSGLTPVLTTTSGDIIFNGTVNGVAGGGAENLTITGGAGSSVDFTTTVGATNPLGSLSITADSVNLGGNITGTATLTLQPGANATTVGIGDGASGTFHLTNAEINRIQNGFTSILIGRTTSTAAYDLRASTWNDPVNFRSSGTATGTLTGNLTGLGNTTITLGVPTQFNGNSISTAGQTITLSAASTIADGQTLTLTNGGTTGNITISGTLNGTAGGATENLVVNAGTAAFNNTAIIGGTAALGDLTVSADILTIGANISGTGTALLQPVTPGQQVGIGNSSTGAFQLDSTEATRLVNGWGQLIVGRTDGTGAVNIRSVTFNDPLQVRTDTGAITTTSGALAGTGDAAFGFTFNNSFTLSNGITTAGGDIVFNGTGTLTLASNLTTAGGDIDFNTPVTIGSGTTPVLSFGAGTVTVDNTINGVAGGAAENLTFTGGAGSSVTINNAIGGSATLGAITLTTDHLDLAANLTGNGALIIQQASAATTFGLGDGMSGTLHLSDAEIARIQNGFSAITLGATTATGVMQVGSASAWHDPLTLRGAAGGNLQILGSLIGDNNASITLSTAPITLGDGSSIVTNGQAITFGTATTLADGASSTISNGGSTGNITFSSTVNGTAGGLNENLTINAGTTNLSTGIWGGIAPLGNLTITADLINVLNNLTGTGVLTIQPHTQGQTIGIGGATGLFNIDNNEQTRIDGSWSEIIIGRLDGTGDIGLAASLWADPLTLRGSSAILTVIGAQTMGSNNLTISTDGLSLLANLSGTGDLIIEPGQQGTTLGLGDSALGALNLTDTELAFLANGWNSITFGRTDGTGDIDLRAYTWNDPLTLRGSGSTLTTNGNQTMGANSLSLDVATINLGHNVSASGAANLDFGGNITITSGITPLITWGSGALTFDGTILGTAGGANENLTLTGGAGSSLTINSTISGLADIALTTDSIAINDNLSGTGTLTIAQAQNSTSMGLGDTALGTLNLTTTELNHLQDGFAAIIFGAAGASGTTQLTASSWLDPVTFRSGTLDILGDITSTDSLTFASNTATNIATGVDIATSGTDLSFSNSTAIVLAEGSSTLLSVDNNGTITLNGSINGTAGGVAENLTLSGGTGSTLTANSTIGDSVALGNLTITMDSLDIAGSLSGSGTLTLQPLTQNRSIGLGTGSTGDFQLTTTELNLLTDGWANINLGRTDGTGAIDLRGLTWNDPITFRSNTGLLTTYGNTTGAGNASITLNAPTLLGHNITTSGENILFNNTLTLAQNVTLSSGAGAGDITFSDTLAGGGYNLTLTAGTGNILFADAVTNLGSGTGAALTVTSANLTQADSTIAANSGLNITGNSLWTGNLTLGNGDTATQFNNDVTFDGLTLSGYDGFTFHSPVTLTGGSLALTSNGGNITFSDTLDGAQSLSLAVGSGDLNFTGILGGTTALTSITASDVGLLNTNTINANSFTSVGTGNAIFGGSGLNLSGNFSITANDITGDFTGDIGSLLAQGDITANLDLSELTISGTSATLLGNVGLGLQNQAMANRINKTNTTGPNPDYTLNGFEIGFIPAPPLAGNLDVMTLSIWGPTTNYFIMPEMASFGLHRLMAGTFSSEEPEATTEEPKRRSNKYKRMGQVG